MTREVLKLALETLEIIDNWLPTIGQRGLRDYEADTITAIKAALAEPDQNLACKSTQARLAASWGYVKAQPEQVTHTVIAGALFDFMGYLTSRRERIVLSASDDAAPAVDAIRDFAKKRGLSLDDAQVREWIDALAQQGAEAHLQAVADFGQLQEQEPVAWISNSGVVYPLDAKDEVHPINELQPLFTSSPKRQPLTDKKISDLWCEVSNTDFVTADTHVFARAIEAAHGIGDKA